MAFSKTGPWYVTRGANCSVGSGDTVNLTDTSSGDILVTGWASRWGTFNGKDADYTGRAGTLTETSGSPNILHFEVPGSAEAAYWTAQDQRPPGPPPPKS